MDVVLFVVLHGVGLIVSGLFIGGAGLLIYVSIRSYGVIDSLVYMPGMLLSLAIGLLIGAASFLST